MRRFDSACREQLAERRAAQPAGSALSLLHTRAAVHHGLALLCNAGTKKSNFMVLGECVNTRSRIGSVAAELKRPLLLSFELGIRHTGHLQLDGWANRQDIPRSSSWPPFLRFSRRQ